MGRSASSVNTSPPDDPSGNRTLMFGGSDVLRAVLSLNQLQRESPIMRYMIQFIAGTRSIVIEALAQTMQHLKLVHDDDSALVFESSTRIDTSNQLPFANNVFTVIASTPRKGVDQSIRRLVSKVERVEFPRLKGQDRGFRIMAQIDGQLTPIERRLRGELEREIAVFTQSQVQAKGSCREYWIVGRKGFGELMLCFRLPKDGRRQPAKGELAYELSLMLVAASVPDRSDTYLDPFAGNGGLVLARLESPAKSITYSDIALRTHSRTLPRALKSDRRVRLMAEDALSLPSINDGQIDVIVTDPPWGEFAQVAMGYQSFVEGMAKSFDRVLHPAKGRFVILSSRRQSGTITTSLVSRQFKIRATHSILVNGHPASVIVGGR